MKKLVSRLSRHWRIEKKKKWDVQIDQNWGQEKSKFIWTQDYTSIRLLFIVYKYHVAHK
jgi:hypothetical protein